MNLAILQPEVQQFISKNIKSDVTKLILKGSPFTEISVQELVNQIIAKQKSITKLPTWFSTPYIYYPPKISIEQTSSEITATYKSKLVSGNALIDLTGGFGIDSYYFAKHFKKVTHCEINADLSTIVKYNFNQLKVKNITTYTGNGFDFLKKATSKFDCIYIDPSRRNDVKGKVFLLKDCLPYIPPKIDFFFSKANQILIKVSPILDITNTIRELKNVKEVHIVALNNDVKEVLFLLEKDYENKILIKTANIRKNNTETFHFYFTEPATSKYEAPLSYLYEPNAAILKSGGFHQVSHQLNVFKIHQHSHLYTSNSIINFPGRYFKIAHVLKYDKKKIKRLLPNKKANITTRNFPKSVAQIRKELQLKDGGDLYLFFTTDFNNQKIIIVCEKIT